MLTLTIAIVSISRDYCQTSGGIVVEHPNWVHLPDAQKGNLTLWLMEESRHSLQSTQEGAGQLLLNSQAPQGAGGNGFYTLESGLRGV